MSHVDDITVESDDRGFELHLGTDEGRFVFNVHSCAVQLYNEVVKEIGPWIGEMLDARREFQTGISDDPDLQPILDRIKGLDDTTDHDEELRHMVDVAWKAAKENP